MEVYSLQGADCATCADKVRAELKKAKGVKKVEFDKQKVELTVRMEDGVAATPWSRRRRRRPGSPRWWARGRGRTCPSETWPAGADMVELNKDGAAVGPLDKLRVPGKFTVFDVYADWCGPCRDVDERLRKIVAKRPDVAVRKLNVVDFDSPLAVELGGRTCPALRGGLHARGQEDRDRGAELEKIDKALQEAMTRTAVLALGAVLLAAAAWAAGLSGLNQPQPAGRQVLAPAPRAGRSGGSTPNTPPPAWRPSTLLLTRPFQARSTGTSRPHVVRGQPHGAVGVSRPAWASKRSFPSGTPSSRIRFLDAQRLAPGAAGRRHPSPGRDARSVSPTPGSPSAPELRSEPGPSPARAGVTLPLGRTEPDPFALGDLGLPTSTSSSGPGPGTRCWAPRRAGASARTAFTVSALARLVVAENGHGYQAGHRSYAEAMASRRLAGGWSGRLGLDVAREEPERWAAAIGPRRATSAGRDLLAAAGVGRGMGGAGTLWLTARVPLVSPQRGSAGGLPGHPYLGLGV